MTIVEILMITLESCVLNFEFFHELACLMRLFPRSLTGKDMEWFTKLSPPLKSFDQIVHRFIQQYSYNIQNFITMFDLYNIKQHQGKPFMTFFNDGGSFIHAILDRFLSLKKLTYSLTLWFLK